MYPPLQVPGMPTLEITDEQATFLDALQGAIEDELVGPYGTVRRVDALQYLIDHYGEPDELLGEDEETPDAGPVRSEDEESEDETDEAEADDDAEDAAEDGKEDDHEDESSDRGATPEPGGSDGDAMLDEMMSLLDTHDDKWRKADTAETQYEVDLPDDSTETVQTKDDVRALLFKNYR
jgi:hypothetical protein